MRVEVVYVIGGTTHTDEYTGAYIARQLCPSGLANIRFHRSGLKDSSGRKMLTAQYRCAEVIYTYDD